MLKKMLKFIMNKKEEDSEEIEYNIFVCKKFFDNIFAYNKPNYLIFIYILIHLDYIEIRVKYMISIIN
jgi:hypothetical protein